MQILFRTSTILKHMTKHSLPFEWMETNQKIISGFREGRQQVLVNVYKKLVLIVSSYLSANNGTFEDAKELTWSTMEAFRVRCLNPSFSLTDTDTGEEIPFRIYIAGIYKNIWKKTLKQRKKDNFLTSVSDIEAIENLGNHHTFTQKPEEAFEYKELLGLVISKIKMMSPGCRKLFYLHVFNSWSHSKIQNSTKLANSVSATQTKMYICRERLSTHLSEMLGNDWDDIKMVKKFLSRKKVKTKNGQIINRKNQELP